MDALTRSAAAPRRDPGPNRAPVVCGALGDYARSQVLRIAAALDGGLRPVHEDASSMLMLDRSPAEWRGPGERGLGWIEGDLWRGGASGWREAARFGACGLVIDGRRRFVHSAVNGLAPVYWIDDGKAAYFASRIDPLVRTAPSALSVDWDAWAAIIALRYPVGDRTPFAEIRRLGPFSTLRWRFGRARCEAPAWPWAELEPSLGLDPGADRLIAALRDALAPLGEGVVCPLSGGRDSRILLQALAERGQVSRAVTVSDDEGARFEEDLAAPVAKLTGVAHERLAAPVASYPGEWEERARRVEYQFVDHAWLVPLARRLEGIETPVPDGFALDTLFQAGSRFYTPETLDRRRHRRARLALFDSLRRYGRAQMALTEPFREPVVVRARDQFVAAAKPFAGHPSQAVLSLYATRSVRGVSTYPSGLLGERARVITPGAHDAVAAAILAIHSHEKSRGRLYTAVFERLAPLRELPSTSDVARPSPRLPRRWRAEASLEAYARSLAAGPLARHLAPDLRSWLEAPGRAELSGDLRLGMEAISLFHAWWRRYRGQLRTIDPSELAGG